MFKSIFSFAAIIALLSCNLFAVTYYVDNVGGNDANSGTSTSAAWKTLSKVQSKTFVSGDIVSFKCGGRYSGVTLTGKSNITFNSYGSGPRPVIDGQSLRKCFDFDSQTNINFNGLNIVNGTPQCINLWRCTYVTVESCNVDSSKGGDYHFSNIYTGYGSNLTVRNSTINYGYQGSPTVDPYGNLGIYIDQTQNTLLEHDTLIGNRSNIRIGFGDGNPYEFTRGLIVRYCVVKNGVWDNVDDDGSYGAQFYYNVFESGAGSWYHVNIYLFSDGSGAHATFAPKFGTYCNNTFIQRGGNIIFSVSPDFVIQTEGMQFDNNIIYNDAASELWEDITPWTGFNVFFNHNLYYATNGTYQFRLHNVMKSFTQWQSAGYDSVSKCADPLFTNYSKGDYSLQSGSPALGYGKNVGLATDIKGNPVPSGSPDVGAFQHNAPSPATYYVSNSGNDNNSGTSSSSPWKTISKVNSKTFIPGDIILFRRGDTWSEILTPQGSGNAANPITFDAYGSGNLPIIDGGNIRANCISLNAVNYITIKHFRVQYAAVNTTGDIHAQYTDHLRIECCDCYITSHGGVFIESSTNGYIGYCTMSSPVSNNDNQVDGIYSQRNSACTYENNSIVITDIGAGHNDGIQSYLDADMTLRNNYIYQNNTLTTAQGIDISDGAGTFYVYNNVVKCPNSTGNIIGFNNNISGTGIFRCYQNTVLGNVNCLRILKCADVIVKNNIFYSNNATSIIDIGTTLNPTSAIDYNLYNRSGSGSMVNYEPQGLKTYAQWQALGFETHGINANPIVNDTLCPATNSPVINTGANLGGIFMYDKEGVQRPVDGVDLGAYELPSAPTPVELSSFNGIYINKSVHLKWSTATEINNQGFEIERYQNDSWLKLGFVQGKGNSVTKNDYSFEDQTPVGSSIQYRLKQIDNNGNFKYYDAITIAVVPQEFFVGNYPNPFNPSTKVKYSIPTESFISISIYNILGEKIDELKNEIQQSGTYELNWNAAGHPSGIYLLSLIESPVNGSSKNSKVIKMNLIK